MNENTENLAQPDELPDHSSEVAVEASVTARFFHRTDWVSFCVTTILVLAVYLWTLAPNYAGVPHPLGFPIWTVYAWLFTKLLPFSNVAWRVAVSSAVAGASVRLDSIDGVARCAHC